MSAVDNLIGMGLIAGIILAGWFLMQMGSFSQDTKTIELTQFNFEQQKLSRDLGSILEISEPITKLPVSKIIGDLIYAGDGNVDFRGVLVDLKNGFLTNVFDGIYGKNNYYVEVSPPISKVRLFFVVDGSMTMSDDISAIDESILSFKTKAQEVFSNGAANAKQVLTEVKVYILNRGEAYDSNINCKNLSKTVGEFGLGSCVDIYPDNKMNTSAFPTAARLACSAANDNKGIYSIFKNTIYSDKNDFFLGYDQTYRGGRCAGIGKPVLNGEFYEDWATGTAYVAKIEKAESYYDENQPVVTLFFPISDELSTGSEADSCYSIGKNNTVSDFYAMNRCKVCVKDQNRFLRADKSIDHAIKIFEEDPKINSLGYKIFPILTKSNYFAEKETYCDSSGNLCTDLSNCKPCCGKVNCPACVIDPVNADKNTGLHSDHEVMTNIFEDMNRLALSTGGKVLDFSKGYNANVMRDAILGLAKESATFTLGNPNLLTQKIERITISRIIPLGNSNLAEMRFTVAKYRGNAPTRSADYINLPPVPIISIRNEEGILTSSGQLKKNDGTECIKVKIDSASYDPEGEKIDFNWYIDGAILAEKNNVSSFDYNFCYDGNYKIKIFVKDPFDANAWLEKMFEVSTKPLPKVTFFFVPLNWGSLTEDSFVTSANDHASEFFKMVPCPEKFGIEIIMPSEVYSTCKNLNVGISNAENALSTTMDCAERYYGAGRIREQDRVIGLTGKSIGDSVMGYTNFSQKSVIAFYADATVSPHEIGHTYNFCDEYSLYYWMNQSRDLVPIGGCVNPYPENCKITKDNVAKDPLVCKKDDVCLRIENSLNCPKEFKFNGNIIGDCDAPLSPPLCGNLREDTGETIINCPSDFVTIDCFGKVLGTDVRGVMGPSLYGSSYSYVKKDFTNEQKEYFIDKGICD